MMIWGSLGLPGLSKHFLERRLLSVCLQSDFSCWSYFVLQHTTFGTVLFVIYDKVHSLLSPWSASLETPTSPLPFLQHLTSIELESGLWMTRRFLCLAGANVN